MICEIFLFQRKNAIVLFITLFSLQLSLACMHLECDQRVFINTQFTRLLMIHLLRSCCFLDTIESQWCLTLKSTDNKMVNNVMFRCRWVFSLPDHPLRLRKVESVLQCSLCLINNVLRLQEKQRWGKTCVSYKWKVYLTSIIFKKNMLFQDNDVTLFTHMTQFLLSYDRSVFLTGLWIFWNVCWNGSLFCLWQG